MKPEDKVYVTISVLFSVLIVMGNLIYQKFVQLPILPFHTFELSVGAILYPLTFLLTDIIAECYGKEKANFCVKVAMCMNISVACIIIGMDHLQATTWSKVDNATFHHVFGMYSVSFIGSIIACYIAQMVDIAIFMWIRKLTKGRWMWLRSNGSTMCSLFIDTAVVISFMTAFGVLPVDRMVPLIFNSYVFKLFFAISATPIFYICVSFIRQYDKKEAGVSSQYEVSLQ